MSTNRPINATPTDIIFAAAAYTSLDLSSLADKYWTDPQKLVDIIAEDYLTSPKREHFLRDMEKLNIKLSGR